MKTSSTFAIYIFFMTAAISVAQPLDGFLWLAGKWIHHDGSLVTEEQWMKPAGGIMLGMSRTIVDGEAAEFEAIRIVQEKSGAIHYIAHPSGQREATFTLIDSSRGTFIFENREHDFPQRIIYRRVHADSLVASIEGLRNGQVKRIDFPMRRVPCDE